MSKIELIASLKWKIEKWCEENKTNPNVVYEELIAQAQKELKRLNASQNQSK